MTDKPDIVEDWQRATDEWTAVTAAYEAARSSALEPGLTDEERLVRERQAEQFFSRAGEIKSELAAIVAAGRARRSGTGDSFVAGVIGSMSSGLGTSSDLATPAAKLAKS